MAKACEFSDSKFMFLSILFVFLLERLVMSGVVAPLFA